MTILQATKPKASSAVNRSGRLFLLELSGDRIHSMRYSGYAGSGNDRRRALELARANLANRPTRRALKQVQTIAVSAGEAAGRTAGSSADDMNPGALIARRPAHSILG